MWAGEGVLQSTALWAFCRNNNCSWRETFCQLNDREWFGLVMQTGNCSVGLACETRNRVDSMKQSKQLPSEDSVGCQNWKCVSETREVNHTQGKILLSWAQARKGELRISEENSRALERCVSRRYTCKDQSSQSPQKHNKPIRDPTCGFVGLLWVVKRHL